MWLEFEFELPVSVSCLIVLLFGPSPLPIAIVWLNQLGALLNVGRIVIDLGAGLELEAAVTQGT